MAEPYTQLMTRLTEIGATVETTSGTAATVTTPLANTLCYEIKCNLLDAFAQNERLPQGLYFGQTDAMSGELPAQLSWKQELRSGDQFLPLLAGCGWLAGGSTYNVTSDMASRKTFTFAIWQNGRRFNMIGCAGTCRITGKSGGRVFAEWQWSGRYSPMADEAMPAQAPIHASSFINSSVAFTVAGAAAPPIANYEIDLGAQVAKREDITAPGSILHYYVEELKPLFTIDPEARLVANNDQYGLMLSSTSAALSLTFGSGTGGQLIVTAPRLQRRLITDEDRGGKRIDRIKYSANLSSGDDELTFQSA